MPGFFIPPKHQSMINDLDKMLGYLYDNRKMHRAMDLNKVLNIPNNDFTLIGSEIVLEKLFKDGYAERDPNDLGSPRYYHYSISLEGVLFFERSLIRKKPYKSEILTKRVKSIWSVIKIIMAGISTLAIVWISWLTYDAQREANMLEKNKKNEPPPIINVIIDTVKKK